MKPRSQPAALGSASAEGAAACLFCGASLKDGGAAFLDHIARSPGCRAAYGAYGAWVERLDEDRPGG